MMDFMRPMVRAMKECGFGVFSFDHEGGDGQVEFDFDFAPSLVTADRMTFFRLMAKQIAKQGGLMVTFMPKPYTDAWGSGAHFNMSLTDPAIGDRTCSATPRTPAAGAGARRPTASPPASCATPRRWPRSAPRPSIPTSDSSPGCPTAPCRGRRRGPPTATTTVPACCASPATARPWRTGASTPPPTPTWPPPSCWPPGSRAWPRASTPASRSRT